MNNAGGMRFRIAHICALALALAILVASPAQAGEVVFAPQDNNHPTVNDGWQAGTCTADPAPPAQCSIATPSLFFETAAGHPPAGFTQFIVKHQPETLTGHEEPEVNMKTLRVDLPVGLSVNPGATPQCKAAHPSECATQEPLSRVGKSYVYVSDEAGLLPPIKVEADVYNLTPVEGHPARFGFTVEAIPGFEAIPPNDIYLEADVAWESDFHEGFTIDVPKNTGLKLLKNRLVFEGEKTAPGGQGFFITTPSTCWNPNTEAAHAHTYSTYARADSYENPDSEFPNGSPFVESPIPPGTFPKECDTIPFNPTIGLNPATNQVDSPAGAVTDVNIPIESNPKGQETSTVRTARVTLPPGMGLNPSAANGLKACTDTQFGKGTRNPIACPADSKIGTATVVSEALPEEPLTGNVYVGTQKNREPESGEEFRIFVDAASARYGVDVRLIGNVMANAQTGQLTAVFDEPAKTVLRGGNADNIPHGLPQVPFTDFRISLDGGDRAALTSPPTCGPNTATSQLTPWSAEFSGKPPASPSSAFTLSKLPNGSDCPKTMAERPFAPSFSDHTAKPKAGEFSPFDVNITRQDGEQELKGMDVTLPPGVTAKLAGVTYCPESALAAAAAGSGAAEAANPSCPASSLIGTASVLAGTGSTPFHIQGKAFLTGPYHGAPLSLAVVTPATAGPFDLGSVVVRVALFIDPSTGQVHAVSDPIPHVFGGSLLDVRSISVKMDRPNFSLNPTNCSTLAATGTLHGGGANPLDPASFSSFGVSAPFQVNGCDQLGFGPKLSLRVFGGTRRAKNPKLQAVFVTKPGDANPARVSVALPRAFILDQSSISRVCTRVQFAAHECPKNSVYGYARAYTPLLDKPLEGPVYLRSSDNPLPDLVAALRGQVEIDLDGRTDTVHGRLRNTFDVVPDVPVSKFILTVRGGPSGLLTNTVNLCPRGKGKHRHGPNMRANVKIAGQNGKKANQRPLVRTPCHKGKKKHHK